MKKITIILAIILLIFNQSCNKENETETIDCFTPPQGFQFELVDKSTGENLFTNGTFNSIDIKVINLFDQKNVEFNFIDENDYNIISIGSIGWKTEIVYYSIKISSKNIFNLYVNAETVNDKCIISKYNEIRIENSEFELNQESDIYKIFVE